MMFQQLFKYGIVTLISYLLIISGTYVFIEFINFSPPVSYFLTLTITYIGVCIANIKFVFCKKFDKKIILKYIFVLIIFWLFNNVVFSFLLNIFSIHYLLVIVFNIIFFGLIRFFIQQKFVFK